MAKSLLVRDIEKLHNTLNDTIKYVDLDYDVKRPKSDPWTTKTRSLVCRNDYAILNGYRLWLQSRRYDYVRNPNFGGLFDSALNDRTPFGPEHEDTVRNIMIRESNEKWPDINVLSCEVKAIVAERRWHIKIVAQDKKTSLVLVDDNLFLDAEGPPTNDGPLTF